MLKIHRNRGGVQIYTKDDYLDTDKPYAEVYAIKNPFDQRRALERASLEAAQVGVKNFKSIYGEYCKSMRGDLVPENNTTNLEDQPLELSTGDWVVDTFGVHKGIGMTEIVACCLPVYITRRFEDIDSGAEKVELSYRKGGYWRKIIIPCSQYATPKELVKLADAGLGINLRMASDLSDYLTDLYALNFDKLPVSRSVQRLGWVGDGQFSPFVPGIIYDGSPEYAAVFDATRPAGRWDDWLSAAKSFRRESTAARIALAASFASVLVKPLGTLPFFVHLWGVDSSTGKTVALMAAASVWASPEMGKYIKTFDGTDVGYERTAAFLNSLPLCIDELQLARDAKGRVNFNVYRLSQGAGRVRGNRQGGVDSTPNWANAIITTGESPITSDSAGAGAINRVIGIECTSKRKVIKDGHAVAQAFRQSYGHAGRRFVARLTEPGGIEAARTAYEQAFAQLNGSETTDKQAMASALIVAADQLATQWIFEDGMALTAQDMAPYLAKREAVSLGVRGYQYMCDWVARNANRLRSDSLGDVFGVIEGDYAYIISSVFRSAAEEAGFNAQALLSYMRSEGLVKISSGKSSVAKRLSPGSAPVRCVCMRIAPEVDPFTGEEIPVEDMPTL